MDYSAKKLPDKNIFKLFLFAALNGGGISLPTNFMKLIKEEKINKQITQKYSSNFVLADDGLYFIEIIASAKSWRQNLKNFKSLFKDDDLSLLSPA